MTTDYLLGRTDESGPQHIFGADLGAKALLKIYQDLDEDGKRTLGAFGEFLEIRSREKLEL